MLLNGVPVGPGASIAFPAGTIQATLLLRQNPAAASTVAFIIRDICGDWPSFVGVGRVPSKIA